MNQFTWMVVYEWQKEGRTEFGRCFTTTNYPILDEVALADMEKQISKEFEFDQTIIHNIVSVPIVHRFFKMHPDFEGEK